jgi:hypothetical protein
MPSTETDTRAASGSHAASISTPDSQAVGRF